MSENNVVHASVISFAKAIKSKGKNRKSGLNKNKFGSVRNINGKIYVDFIYLDERAREPSGLDWNEKNAKYVREQLDKIHIAIKTGTFRYGEVFPESRKKEHFRELEFRAQGSKKKPDQVIIKDFMWTWYDLLKSSGRITERTLFTYKGYMKNYIEPYFGEMAMAELNPGCFSKFVSWAKNQQYLKREIKNETINKAFIVLKMICKSAAIDHGWGSGYDPFFGFKKPPEGDPYEKICPFSIEEQHKLIVCIPDHWKPYFRFAFCSGLRQGEQIGLKLEDIDWENGLLHIRRAITRDEDGKVIEGRTKNKYSRRSIKLTPVMYAALREQKKIYDEFQGEYFFCNSNGDLVHTSNLRRHVWIPSLKKAELKIREMKQTRHSFATIALSCGENPLWIGRVMGHRNTDMIIRVYGKYIENATGFNDGKLFNDLYKVKESNTGEV